MTAAHNPDSPVEQFALVLIALVIALWFAAVSYATGYVLDVQFGVVEYFAAPLAPFGFTPTEEWRNGVRLAFGFVAVFGLFELTYVIRVDRWELVG